MSLSLLQNGWKPLSRLPLSPASSRHLPLHTAVMRRWQTGLTNIFQADDSLSNIMGYDKYGFTVNKIHMRGSVIVFPHFTMLWNVQRVLDISPRNAAIVHMVKPKPELLLIGTGTKMENINPAMYAYFQRKGISVEVMPTRHAMATFNDLAQEGRRVAAGLISISPVSRDEACMYTSDAVQTEEDRNMQKALARDYSAQEAVKLLEGATAEQKAEAQQLRQEMKEREQQQRKKYLEDSERLAVQYGYPGAQPPDAPLLLMSEAEKQERARASLRPRNAEELIDSIASKNSRRSSGAGGGGGKAS